jgi:hypothetical protein
MPPPSPPPFSDRRRINFGILIGMSKNGFVANIAVAQHLYAAAKTVTFRWLYSSCRRVYPVAIWLEPPTS